MTDSVKELKSKDTCIKGSVLTFKNKRDLSRDP